MKETQPQTLIGVDNTREKISRTLMKAMGDPVFRQQLHSVKGSIAMGRTLEEARVAAGIRDTKRWQYIMEALGRFTISREKLFLEFHTRAQVRYSQISDLMVRHGPYIRDDRGQIVRDKKTGKPMENPDYDRDMESRALAMLIKVDEQQVDLAETMGLLKTEKTDDGGEGYSDEQVRSELDRYEGIIRAQLTSGETALEPLALGVQPEPKAGEQTDKLAEAPVDAHDPGRHKP